MILKAVKYGVLGVAGVALVGGLVFGTDLVSYAGSTARSVRSAVKETVPLEFELQRAKNLLEQILPEMQTNVRLIAHEEVEVASLGRDIQQCRDSLAQERIRVVKLRDALAGDDVMLAFNGVRYAREQVKEELSRRFEAVKEAEMVLAGKQRLLETRNRGLQAAVQVLDRTRAQKARLEDQIAALEGQYRLVKAASVGSQFQLDGSKLAQTERLISDIRKRLDVAERVLAHEAHFTQPIAVDVVDEKDLVAQVNEYLTPIATEPTTRPACEAVVLGSHATNP